MVTLEGSSGINGCRLKKDFQCAVQKDLGLLDIMVYESFNRGQCRKQVVSKRLCFRK